VGFVPNVHELWPRVEGVAISNLFNLFGQVHKTKNTQIIEMSKDTGLWSSHIIVLGAQAQKCYDFYSQMKDVAYYMDPELKDKKTGVLIPKDTGYGYGIILKTTNPHFKNGIGILIGGYGVLGTEAAGYYFAKNCAQLGKLFKRKNFGIIIRASVTAGVESTERLIEYDRCF